MTKSKPARDVKTLGDLLTEAARLRAIILAIRLQADPYRAQLKALNAHISMAKMAENGNKPGRKRRRDDKLIRKLRKAGYSMREIAKKAGCSTTAVQRSLSEARERRKGGKK